MPTTVAHLAREHIEAYLAHMLATRKASTASIRYRSLRRFFDWCAEDGEIAESPMRNMQGPTIPEQQVPVLSDTELRRLLKACEGPDFAERRDTALVLFLLDTGVRRGECAGLTVENVDLRAKVATVVGKGRRPRTVAFGAKTARALDRYLRARTAIRRATTRTASGSASAVRSRRTASARRWNAAAPPPGSTGCTPTASATRSPTPGSQRAATRAT